MARRGVRASVALLLTTACGHAAPAAPAAPASTCFSRYDPYGPTDELTCAEMAVGVLGPILASPGRIRMVFDWPVPGVPPDAEGFHVIDLAPRGQDLVVSGHCPDSGDPRAIGWDGDGRFHVVCVDLVPDPHRRTDDLAFLERARDLELRAGRLVEVRPPLVLEQTAFTINRLVVAYPAEGPPFLLYTTHGDMPLIVGEWRARRWRDDAPAYTTEVTYDEPEHTADEPEAIVVQDGAVRLIVAESPRLRDGADAYRLIELGDDRPIDRGQLALLPPPTFACGRGAIVLASRATPDLPASVDVLLPVLVPIGPWGAEGVGRAHLEHARPVPAATLDDLEQSCVAAEDQDDRWATTCGADGCVAATVRWDEDWQLRVERSARGPAPTAPAPPPAPAATPRSPPG